MVGRIPNARRGRQNGNVSVIIYPLGETEFVGKGKFLSDLECIEPNHKVWLNKVLIPKDEHKTTRLSDGDIVVLDKMKERKSATKCCASFFYAVK